MLIKYLSLGFAVKTIASFDDFLTRIPIIADLTRTRKGKIAFSLGSLAAVFAVISLAIIFSVILAEFSRARYISASLIFVLAILVYFQVFSARPKTIWERILLKIEQISPQRFFKLIGFGFVISFITLIDDAVVFAGLFLDKDYLIQLWLALGIIIATIAEVILIIYFSEKLDRLKYKKEIAALSLIVLGGLIWRGVI